MSANIFRSRVLRSSSLLALSMAAVGCDQPAPTCTVAKGTFSAKYTLVPGSVTGEGTCGELTGEELYVYAYSQRRGEDDPYPDPENVNLAIQPVWLSNTLFGAAGLAEPNPEDQSVAIGAFTRADPGSDDFCTVPTLNSQRVRLPVIPEYSYEQTYTDENAAMQMCTVTVPEQPMLDAQYDWSNVRVYVTAGANGTQFSADLRVSIDGCTAQYRVWAMYPSVSCAAYPTMEGNPATDPDGGTDAAVDMGMDGGPGLDAGAPSPEDPGADSGTPPCDPGPDPGTPVPDDSLCTAANSVSFDGLPVGSNINPDFMVQCDPQLLRCVLSQEPPSLR